MKRILSAFLATTLAVNLVGTVVLAKETRTPETSFTEENHEETTQMFIPLQEPDEIDLDTLNDDSLGDIDGEGGISTLGIIGDDDRYKVQNPYDTPNLQTVLIYATYSDPTTGKDLYYSGTGSLVGEKTVLTAAHMLYMAKYGYVKAIRIYIGYTGTSYLASYAGETAIILPGYKKHKDDVTDVTITPQGDDIGLVTLKSKVDSKYGYVRATSAVNKGDWFTSYGYPVDKNLPYKPNIYQWGVNGQVVSTSDPYYKISADVLGGQSGSPLFNSKNEVFAVVAGGPKTNAVTNSATPVTNGMIELISSSETGLFPIYRLYNANTGEHFYTAAYNEAASLSNAGWKDEGAAWSTGSTGVNVVRLYNPNTGEHHYTINTNEVDSLVKAGWKKEMNAWVAPFTSNRPVYRLYNPNQSKFNHHYTVSTAEKNALVKAGWKDEGIAWYAY